MSPEDFESLKRFKSFAPRRERAAEACRVLTGERESLAWWQERLETHALTITDAGNLEERRGGLWRPVPWDVDSGAEALERLVVAGLLGPSWVPSAQRRYGCGCVAQDRVCAACVLNEAFTRPAGQLRGEPRRRCWESPREVVHAMFLGCDGSGVSTAEELAREFAVRLPPEFAAAVPGEAPGGPAVVQWVFADLNGPYRDPRTGPGYSPWPWEVQLQRVSSSMGNRSRLAGYQVSTDVLRELVALGYLLQAFTPATLTLACPTASA